MKIDIRYISISQHFRDAWVNLMSTKLRTFLAVLGILVGAASVVAMVSGGELMTRQVLLQFQSLGTNLLSVSINQDSSSNNNAEKLSLADIENLKALSNNIDLLAPYASTYNPMFYEGQSLNGSIIGATPNLKKILKLSLAQGRFISFLDHYAPYCVIGSDVAKSMRKINGNSPIGQQINVQGNFFTVVGVLKQTPQNAFLFVDVNQSIFIPIETALVMSKYAAINNLIMTVKGNPNFDTLEGTIKTFFTNISPTYQLYFENPEQFIEKMKNQQAILTLFLGFIGAIALLVGGIGVMNIMLVSVTERKREIGIRMAIGAKRRDIQVMFLIESIMLSLFGGILGVILGILISFVIAEVKGWDFSLFILPPVIGFSISVFIGVFFGFYPAHKASKLDPIDCLRSE